MRVTLLTAAFLMAGQSASAGHIHQRQGNFLSTLKSIFVGDDGDQSSTTRPGRPTPQAPATTTTTRSTVVTTKSTSVAPTSSTTSPTATTTVSTSATTSTTSQSTITSSASLTTITTSSSTTATTLSTTTPLPVDPRPTTQAASGGISPAGIAVAVIFSILIVLLIGWLVFRYHPKCRAWWLARQEEKYKQRSYRDALDAPYGDTKDATSGVSRSRNGLQSFFAPRTAKLGGGREIKRKTINWGAVPGMSRQESDKGSVGKSGYEFSNNPSNHIYGQGLGLQRGFSSKQQGGYHSNNRTQDNHSMGEKVPLAELASPMGMSPPQQGRHFAVPALPSVPSAQKYPPTQTYDVSPELTGVTPQTTNIPNTADVTMSPVSPISAAGSRSTATTGGVPRSLTSTSTKGSGGLSTVTHPSTTTAAQKGMETYIGTAQSIPQPSSQQQSQRQAQRLPPLPQVKVNGNVYELE